MFDPQQEQKDESPNETTELDSGEFAATSEDLISIGDYKIVRNFGRGICTDLYLAESPKSSDRQFVLKVLGDKSEESVKWFASVGSVMNGLDHPNILTCDDIGLSAEGFSYMAMPFVAGGDLWHITKNHGPLEPVRLVQIIDLIARGIDYAHSRGVVHGNLHPKHILVDDKAHPWIIGFGEVTSDRHGFPFGNPHHLAPEQIFSNSIVPASDIYALAEVSFLCLCGSFPFAGHNGTQSMLNQKRLGPVPSIRQRYGDISERVDQVLQRGMAIGTDERYASADDFSKSFSAAVESMTKESDAG